MFAEAIRVSVSTLYRLEHDDPRIEWGVVVDAAKQLGLDVDHVHKIVKPPADLPVEALDANGERRAPTPAERLQRLEDLARTNGKMQLADALRMVMTSGDQLERQRGRSAAYSTPAQRQRDAGKRGGRKSGGDQP